MPKPQFPQTLVGLAKLLAKHGERAMLVPEIDPAMRIPASKVVIDVSRIPGFGNVSNRRGKVSFGTGATFGEVFSQISGENGLLKQALSMLANPLVRNRVTVFEGLDSESPFFDLSTALLTLRARIRLQSASASMILGIEEFLVAAAEGLNRGEFPAQVEFPVLDSNYQRRVLSREPRRRKEHRVGIDQDQAPPEHRQRAGNCRVQFDDHTRAFAGCGEGPCAAGAKRRQHEGRGRSRGRGNARNRRLGR